MFTVFGLLFLVDRSDAVQVSDTTGVGICTKAGQQIFKLKQQNKWPF